MKSFKIDNKGSGRLFSSSVLERMTRTHFLIPVIFYYAVAIVFMWVTWEQKTFPFMNAVWLLPAGWLLFTLVEYLIHRFLFHFHAVSEKELNFQYNIHGVHHEFPKDKKRLVMPPVISILLSAGFYFLFVFLLGDMGMLLFAGFISGYSSYLIIHFAVHALKPPRNFLRFFWTHHSLHHYASVHSAFSVSMPLWDYLFGTLPGKKNQHAALKLPDGKAV